MTGQTLNEFYDAPISLRGTTTGGFDCLWRYYPDDEYGREKITERMMHLHWRHDASPEIDNLVHPIANAALDNPCPFAARYATQIHGSHWRIRCSVCLARRYRETLWRACGEQPDSYLRAVAGGLVLDLVHRIPHGETHMEYQYCKSSAAHLVEIYLKQPETIPEQCRGNPELMLLHFRRGARKLLATAGVPQTPAAWRASAQFADVKESIAEKYFIPWLNDKKGRRAKMELGFMHAASEARNAISASIFHARRVRCNTLCDCMAARNRRTAARRSRETSENFRLESDSATASCALPCITATPKKTPRTQRTTCKQKSSNSRSTCLQTAGTIRGIAQSLHLSDAKTRH